VFTKRWSGNGDHTEGGGIFCVPDKVRFFPFDLHFAPSGAPLLGCMQPPSFPTIVFQEGSGAGCKEVPGRPRVWGGFTGLFEVRCAYLIFSLFRVVL